MRNIFKTQRSLSTPSEQSADFVELFFDLVFVYAITRITALTAHHLDIKHALQSILIFWLIWWGWTQFTWALNAAHTKLAEVRLFVLVATAVVFVMASSVNYAFTDGVAWFAVPYVLVRIIGLFLYVFATDRADGYREAVKTFAFLSVAGLIAVLIGMFVEPSLRAFVWFGAILLDMFAGYVGGKAEGWKLQAEHFVERHGLIVIIALGETLIVAASALSGLERTTELLAMGGLAVVITCLLWWSYFAWLREYMEHHLSIRKKGSDIAKTARDAFSFMHFAIICGIIGVAVGFEIILQHPQDLLSLPVALALIIGQVLFIGCSAASVWRTGKVLLKARILLVLLSSVGIALTIGYTPIYAFSVFALSMLLINILEWKKCHHAKAG